MSDTQGFDFSAEAAKCCREEFRAAHCKPCADGYHGDCTWPGEPSCKCRLYSHGHEVTGSALLKSRTPRRELYAGWTADEINDHEHDLGIGPWETKYDDREAERRDQVERTSVPYEIGGE